MMYDFLVDLFGNSTLADIIAGTFQSILPLFVFILPFALFASRG